MPELVCAADSPDWLTERRKGITATDIVALIGLAPEYWQVNDYSLFYVKRGDIPDTRKDTPRLKFGRRAEPMIVEYWEEDTGRTLIPGRAGLYRSSARPWQMATPDKLLIGNEPLELKSWADIDRERWQDGPPAHIRAQVLWQMDTLDVATGHVGVLFLPSGEFRSYIVEHDERCHTTSELADCMTCTDLMLLREAGRDFMDRLDLNDPPSPDASTATLAALKARFADPMRDKTAEIEWADWQLYEDACKGIAHWEENKRQSEAVIREQAGEARTLTVNGTPVATRVVAVQNVKAHQRHMDYIRRTTGKGESE